MAKKQPYTHSGDINSIQIPVYKYSVEPLGEGTKYFINLEQRPNLFWRFWMWIFFGWVFRRIK